MRRISFSILFLSLVLSACGVNINGRFYSEDTTELHFRVEEFTEVPENLPELQSLKILSLLFSDISEIDSLSTLTNLRELYLMRNDIGSISGLNGLDKLMLLNLAENSISNLSDFPSLPMLITLDLSENPIKELSGLENCPHLQILRVEGTQIRSISQDSFVLLYANDVKIYAYEDETAVDVMTFISNSVLDVMKNENPNTNEGEAL